MWKLQADRVHEILPLVCNPSHMNAVHSPLVCTSLRSTLMLSFSSALGYSKKSPDFRAKIIREFVFSRMRAACQAHLILLNLVFPIIFCQDCKL